MSVKKLSLMTWNLESGVTSLIQVSVDRSLYLGQNQFLYLSQALTGGQ